MVILLVAHLYRTEHFYNLGVLHLSHDGNILLGHVALNHLHEVSRDFHGVLDFEKMKLALQYSSLRQGLDAKETENVGSFLDVCNENDETEAHMYFK